MFGKVLIANRGEIACRVIKTAKRMGIGTVAVYSDADSDARHVAMADESVWIGGAAAAESYLAGERILDAARKTGAEALHPGYGFLSENADFARDCKKAGIIFIGPNADAIARMGDKIESKILAEKAGAHTIPGHGEALKSAEEAPAIASGIGYPLMVKAAAGGGGKGMRVAREGDNLEEMVASAIRESEAAFGDGRVFLEKYIENPRHIEIQILRDRFGSGIHLGERECSIQRRNQKIIEEAPSPFLDAAMREAMGKEALSLAEAVAYESAGTVEFVADRDKHFYFLEMNTRLQVEHPVTELITGLDLVEEMFRIAAGEPLRYRQEDVALKGWAFEARLYAEEPEQNFLPAAGSLSRFRLPEGENIRADTGVEEGDEVSIYYDPMIAKLCSWGDDRDAARREIFSMLERVELEGISNNRLFLSAIFAHERFARGDLSTSFLEEEYPEGYRAERSEESARRDAAMVALFAHWGQMERARGTRVEDSPLRQTMPDRLVVAEEGGEALEFSCAARDGGLALSDLSAESEHFVRSAWRFGQRLFRGEIDGRDILMQIRRERGRWEISHGGSRLMMRVLTPFQASLVERLPKSEAGETMDALLCPMPGQVTKIHVRAGDVVKAGQALAHVEAMKMENVLYAEHDAVIEEVVCEEGDTLALEDPIIIFGDAR